MWDRTGIREFHKSYSLETKPFSLMSVVKMTFGDGTLSSSLRCSRMRHEIPFSPSAQRLPKACSDTPCMDTRIFVSISDWLVSYAPYDWSYSCKISKYKYCHAHIVFSFKARPCFALEKVEKAMSDSSGYCNLCCRVIEERNERKFGNIFAIDRKQVRLQKLCCKTEKTITYRANRKIGSRTEKP